MAASEISPNNLPFIGRETELSSLRDGLTQAQGGGGSAWALLGPGGMGKTRLLRALEQEALRRGIKVRWGYCLKESISPFFPFEQIFRRSTGVASGASEERKEAATGTLLFEEERPKRVLAQAARLAATRPLLLISRDRPALVRQKQPDLPASATVLWLSRSEGPESLSPGAIDALGERIETFLTDHPQAVVALTGLEYLISQNSFLPVLRLVQMLRDTTESAEGTMLLAVHAATLEDRERSLLEAEAEVLRDAPAAADGPAAPPDNEPPALKLLRYLETLQQESRTAPQLLLLDDLQWADAQSRTAFQFLARNARDSPVMMVAALREEEDGHLRLPGEASMVETLDHLDQEGVLRTLRLGGLGQADAGKLAESLVGAPLALEASDRAFLEILERTQGNPYFFLESLQQLVELGYVRKEGGKAVLALPKVDTGEERSGRALPLPASIRRLVVRRLESVAPDDRKFLDLASIVGSEFDLAPVAQVLGRPEAEVAGIARRMEREHRLLQAADRPGKWEFAHPLVWEVLREELPPTEEREHALRLARWWEGQRPQDVETTARLYHQARDREGGLRWIPRAIDRALAVRGFDAVLRLVRWRQELLTASAVDVNLRAVAEIPVVSRLHFAGGGSVARLLGHELLDLSLEPPLRWEARIAYALVAFDRDPQSIGRLLEELDQELQSRGAEVPPDLMARMLNQRSAYAINTGNWKEGDLLGQRAAQLPRQALTPDTLVVSRITRAWCLRELSRLPESLALLEEARGLLEQSRIPETRVRFYNALGATLYHMSHLQEAKDAIQEGMRLAHEQGNVNLEVLYGGNLANMMDNIGDYEEALRLTEEIVSLADKFQLERGRAAVLLVRAAVLRDLGRYPEAEEVGREVLAYARERKNEFQIAEVGMFLAFLHGLQGEPQKALEEFRSVEKFVTDQQGTLLGYYLIDRSRLRAQVGEVAAAREDLSRVPELSDQFRNPLFQGFLLMARSDVERTAGELARSDELRQEARSLMRGIGVKRFRSETLDPMPAGVG